MGRIGEMKFNAPLLVDHITKASIGGLVKDVVFGNYFSFAVIDESESVVCISQGIGDSENPPIGIVDLKKFKRMIEYARKCISDNGQDVEMQLVDDRLVSKNGDDIIKFVLNDPETISGSVANPDDVIGSNSVGDATVIVLDRSQRMSCLRAIKLCGPKRQSPKECAFVVDSGTGMLICGDKKTHRVKLNLGVVKGGSKFRLVVNSDFLTKILEMFMAEEYVTVELRERMPIVFDVPNYTVLLLYISKLNLT